MKRILFVDRDGTIIHEPEDFQVDRLDKVKLVDGVIPALISLQNAGYLLVMVSNQDGIGTTSFPQQDFDIPHHWLLNLLASQGIQFDEILVCPHFEHEQCQCRKPKLGLLTKYLQANDIDWPHCAVIGDRESDMILAKSLHIKGYKLNTGLGPWTWPQIVADLNAQPRQSSVTRKTKETNIVIKTNLDGTGCTNIKTGIGFFDHMLEQLGRHSNIDIDIVCQGDTHIDDHHTVEDVGLALGDALRQALSNKFAIQRYGFCLPMDECRAEALIDLCNRPVVKIHIPFTTQSLGQLSTEMIPHFFQSLAQKLGANLHLTVTGDNNHHMAEAAFKAFARALAGAIAKTDTPGIPSSKGVL